MNKILIVENDDIDFLGIDLTLRELGYDIIEKTNKMDRAIRSLDTNQVDLAIIDIRLKGEAGGIEFAEAIREKYDLPIIFLASSEDTEALEHVADNSAQKSFFEPCELNAAIKIALFRHNNENGSSSDIQLSGGYHFDKSAKLLMYKNQIVYLTKKELQFLELLIRYRGGVVSYDMVENELWPDKWVSDSTRRNVISRLRAKFRNDVIKTVMGIGYKVNM